MPGLSLLPSPALAAILRQDAPRPESGAILPLLIGIVVLGLVLGLLRYAYLRVRGPRRPLR